MYMFRTFDLNFYSYLLQAKRAPGKSAETYKEIAMRYLRIAESLRRDSVYSTFMTIHFFWGAFWFFLSFIAYEYVDLPILVLPLFGLGLLFVFFSLLSLIQRHRNHKILSWIDKISWKLGELPDILHLNLHLFRHLIPWMEVQKLRADDEMCKYLESRDHYNILLRLIRYSIDPKIRKGINCRK